MLLKTQKTHSILLLYDTNGPKNYVLNKAAEEMHRVSGKNNL